jgi:hypothetical protein
MATRRWDLRVVRMVRIYKLREQNSAEYTGHVVGVLLNNVLFEYILSAYDFGAVREFIVVDRFNKTFIGQGLLY